MNSAFFGTLFLCLTPTGRQFLKDTLGEDCFDDGSDAVGNFWMILQTRPYMRVMKFLVEVYYHLEKYEEATCALPIHISSDY